MMPGLRTPYAQLAAILELSAQLVPTSTEDLVSRVERRTPPHFMYTRWSSEAGERVGYCSRSAIVEAVGLAIKLRLMEEGSGSLTKLGQRAAATSEYEAAVREAVVELLEHSRCALGSIERTATKQLRGMKELPTADTLYDALSRANEVNLERRVFKTLLRLLASCGGIGSNRRQIFYPEHNGGRV